MRGRSVVVATACFLAACSWGALDGFSGGAEPDAGASTDGASATDATGASDTGGETNDAAGEASSGPFCASLQPPARACLDFDDGQIPIGFSKTEKDGASVSIGPIGKDGTNGFVSNVTSGALTSASACIWVPLQGPRTGLVIEADFRIETTGSGNYEIVNVDTEAIRELGVSLTDTTLYIEEDYPTDSGTQGERSTEATIPAKPTWQRLRFVIEAVTGSAHSELWLDGVRAAEHEGLLSTAVDTTRIEIGDCALAGAKGWVVHYDNVVVYETK